MNMQYPDLIGRLLLTLVIIAQMNYYLIFVKICSLFDKMDFLSLLNFHSVPAVCCCSVNPQ